MATQDLSNKKQGFMTRYVAACQAFMVARETLRALKAEWDANGYSTAIVQADINAGSLLHLTPAVLANGFNAQVQLENLLNNVAVTTGNWTTNFNAMIG